MILKASQRAGARQLARHLLRTDENDHVEVLSLRGFVARDLAGALTEAEAVARGTRCKRYLFSLSLNPPKHSGASIADLVDAVDRAESALGLTNVPRAVVLHEKCGRLHAHAVWSRIDPVRLRAVPMSHFKFRLAAVSKELFLHHGWDLPEGHKQNGWKDPASFTLAEWQQAKRIDADPRELKAIFRAAWAASHDLKSFTAALARHGYYLARGDRRAFVAVDVHGEVFSVARQLGIHTGQVKARLGCPDGLPSVAEVIASLQPKLAANFRAVLKEARLQNVLELAPHRASHRTVVLRQRQRRVDARHVTDFNPCARVRLPSPTSGGTSSSPIPRNSRMRSSPPIAMPRSTQGPVAEPRMVRLGELSLFIRSQRPDENYEDYQAYRRACQRIIDKQLDERRSTQRRIEEAVAAQRARRFALIAHIAQLTEPPNRRPFHGSHPW